MVIAGLVLSLDYPCRRPRRQGRRRVVEEAVSTPCTRLVAPKSPPPASRPLRYDGFGIVLWSEAACTPGRFGKEVPLVVWISGPTSSGKSTLAKALGLNGWSVIEEQIPSKLLEGFADNPNKFGERLQAAIMEARHDQWVRLQTRSHVVFDRSISEDFNVFCRLHHRKGRLTDTQLSRLEAIAANLQVEMPAPDLIVFLTASRSTLASRGHTERQPDFIQDTLDDQFELYEEWLATRSENRLTLDTTESGADSLRRLLWSRDAGA